LVVKRTRNIKGIRISSSKNSVILEHTSFTYKELLKEALIEKHLG